MQSDFLSDLIETAVRNEVRNYLSENDINWVQLAQCHSIKMIEEIKKILDSSHMTTDEMLNQIMKIIVFCPVPPHIS